MKGVGIYKMKVEGQASEDFKVNVGLRQGCVLSPLLFSLYINGIVKKLKEGKCGIEYGDEIVPCLLFADDTCLVASNAPDLMSCMDASVDRHW